MRPSAPLNPTSDQPTHVPGAGTSLQVRLWPLLPHTGLGGQGHAWAAPPGRRGGERYSLRVCHSPDNHGKTTKANEHVSPGQVWKEGSLNDV